MRNDTLTRNDFARIGRQLQGRLVSAKSLAQEWGIERYRAQQLIDQQHRQNAAQHAAMSINRTINNEKA